MDQRSKTIVAVGIAAVLISLGIFIVLYSGYEHRITFVTDPDDMAKSFVVVDEDTGKVNPVEKGATVFDYTTIRSNTTEITWVGEPEITDGSPIKCKCKEVDDSRDLFTMWIHGADILGAELVDGVLCVHVTDTYYNFALALGLSESS